MDGRVQGVLNENDVLAKAGALHKIQTGNDLTFDIVAAFASERGSVRRNRCMGCNSQGRRNK